MRRTLVIACQNGAKKRHLIVWAAAFAFVSEFLHNWKLGTLLHLQQSDCRSRTHWWDRRRDECRAKPIHCIDKSRDMKCSQDDSIMRTGWLHRYSLIVASKSSVDSLHKVRFHLSPIPFEKNRRRIGDQHRSLDCESLELKEGNEFLTSCSLSIQKRELRIGEPNC